MSAAVARKIRAKYLLPCDGPHPLEGKTVAQWVAEARAGWPKVPPVPRDPMAAARKVYEKHADEVELTLDHAEEES